MLTKDRFLNTYLSVIKEDRKNAIEIARANQLKHLNELGDKLNQLPKQLFEELEENNLTKFLKTYAEYHFNSFLKHNNNDIFTAVIITIRDMCHVICNNNEDILNYQNDENITNNPDAVKICEITVKYLKESRQLWEKLREINDQNPTEMVTDQDTGFVDYFDKPLCLNDAVLYQVHGDLFYGVVVDSSEHYIKINTHKKNDVRHFEFKIEEKDISTHIVCIEDFKIDPSIINDLKNHIEI